MYEANEKHKIPIRPDDPVINPGPGKLVLIIFTDFECPHCGTFEKYLSERIAPLFGDKLKIVFKYFPTNKACNPRVRDSHPHACQAASAAEAARTLGGNEAFWKAHDVLFEAGRTLADFDYRALAEELELNPEEFLTAMDSEQVQARIKEDIELAFEVEVNATPALYLSGRRVPRIAMRSQVFWQVVKARLDRILQAREARQKQQTETSQQPQTQPAATPDNRGPSAGG
jgi:protein-disulfide isomerase